MLEYHRFRLHDSNNHYLCSCGWEGQPIPDPATREEIHRNAMECECHHIDMVIEAMKAIQYEVDTVYGFFCGGDPRLFCPEGEESNTKEEIQKHKDHCAAWDRGEMGMEKDQSGYWLKTEEGVMHIQRSGYGLGVQTIRGERLWVTTCIESLEKSKAELLEGTKEEKPNGG